MADRVTLAQLNQKVDDLITSISEFKRHYENDQIEYRKGVEKHREEHEGIDRILRGKNGSVPGLVEDVRICKQHVHEFNEIKKSNRFTKPMIVSTIILLLLNFIGFTINIIMH